MTSGLTDRVRERLATTPGDLAEAVRLEVGGVVDDAVLERLRAEVAAQLLGLGPLESLFVLPGVTDVLVNGPTAVWIDRGAGLELTDVTFPDDAAVRSLAQRLIASTGRRIDDAAPFADAVLAGGIRVHAVLPPLVRSSTLSLRMFTHRGSTVGDLVAGGAMPPEVGQLLVAMMSARLAFVISGGTGVGKTTLLASLLGQVSNAERIVVVEDTPELAVDHPHVVGLTTRPANVEGAGEIGLRDLVRQSLRMRPDRLVVGEFRGAEMVELLIALNTGHEGGAATLHANTAASVPSRLAALGGLAGLSRAAIAGLAGSALDVVIHLDRVGPLRRVADVAVLDAAGGDLRVVGAWSRTRGHGPGMSLLRQLLAERGVILG